MRKTLVDAIKILIEARNLIEEKGWTKGSYCKDGRYCMLGAINQIVNDDPRLDIHQESRSPKGVIAKNALAHVVRDDEGSSIPEFNDKSSTSKAKVIKAYNNAIESIILNEDFFWPKSN